MCVYSEGRQGERVFLLNGTGAKERKRSEDKRELRD
jgi:hypothetical protein